MNTSPRSKRTAAVAIALGLHGVWAWCLLRTTDAPLVEEQQVIEVTLGARLPVAKAAEPASPHAGLNDFLARVASASAPEPVQAQSQAEPTKLSDLLGDQADAVEVLTGRDASLRPGEGGNEVDHLAAASLIASVGSPPPLSAGLQARLEHCWKLRRTKGAVTLIIDLGPNGRLARPPIAVRLKGAAPDRNTLRAELEAAQIVAACAPYAGAPSRLRVTLR